jgi:hypothetical protein
MRVFAQPVWWRSTRIPAARRRRPIPMHWIMMIGKLKKKNWKNGKTWRKKAKRSGTSLIMMKKISCSGF